MVDLPEFTRSEGEARAEAIRGSHKEGKSIVGPCEVCKCGKVKIADDAEWFLLLRIVHMNCILRCDCVNHSIRQVKS